MDGVKHLQVRLTDEEHARLQEASGHIPLQRFVRSAILHALDEPPDLLDAEGLTGEQRAVAEGIIKILKRGANQNAIMAVKAIVKLAEHPSQP